MRRANSRPAKNNTQSNKPEKHQIHNTSNKRLPPRSSNRTHKKTTRTNVQDRATNPNQNRRKIKALRERVYYIPENKEYAKLLLQQKLKSKGATWEPQAIEVIINKSMESAYGKAAKIANFYYITLAAESTGHYLTVRQAEEMPEGLLELEARELLKELDVERLEELEQSPYATEKEITQKTLQIAAQLIQLIAIAIHSKLPLKIFRKLRQKLEENMDITAKWSPHITTYRADTAQYIKLPHDSWETLLDTTHLNEEYIYHKTRARTPQNLNKLEELMNKAADALLSLKPYRETLKEAIEKNYIPRIDPQELSPRLKITLATQLTVLQIITKKQHKNT